MSDSNEQRTGETDSLRSSRRDLLKGGTALAGLLALGSSSASAQSGVGGGPADDPLAQHRVNKYRASMADRPDPGIAGREFEVFDTDDDANNGKVFVDDGAQWHLVDRQYESVSTESASINPRERKGESNIAKRDIVSTEDIDFTISPSDSIQEAINQIPAPYCQHGIELTFEEGRHDNDDDVRFPVILANHRGFAEGNDAVTIKGETGNPGDVVINTGNNFDHSIEGRVIHRTVVRDLTFESSPTGYGSTLEFNNVILDAGAGPTTSNYAGGHCNTLRFVDCELIPDDSIDVGIHSAEDSEVWIENCSGEVRGELFNESDGGRIHYTDDNEIIGEFPDVYVYDDWRDGRLTDRVTKRHRWQNFYPEWNTLGGEVMVDDNSLVLGDAGTDRQDARLQNHAWSLGQASFTAQLQSAGSESIYRFRAREDSDNIWSLRIAVTGTVELRIVENGQTSTPITGSWDPDTDPHTWEVDVSRDGYEVFLDDTSLGSTSNSFVPAPSSYLGFRNDSDVNVEVDQFILA